MSSQLESDIVAVERVEEYSRVSACDHLSLVHDAFVFLLHLHFISSYLLLTTVFALFCVVEH
jgi:hypothetical protein